MPCPTPTPSPSAVSSRAADSGTVQEGSPPTVACVYVCMCRCRARVEVIGLRVEGYRVPRNKCIEIMWRLFMSPFKIASFFPDERPYAPLEKALSCRMRPASLPLCSPPRTCLHFGVRRRVATMNTGWGWGQVAQAVRGTSSTSRR